MQKFTTAELESAQKAVISTIRKCEKAQTTLATKMSPWAAQINRLAKQLRVLYVAETLIAAELGTQPATCYSLGELDELHTTLSYLTEQVEKIVCKFRVGTPQHTLAVRRIAAFELVCRLVDRQAAQPIAIHRLRDNPTLCEAAAEWFSQKWGIPAEAYHESIEQCIAQPNAIPQWYVVLGDAGGIIAGAGVIDNDFHDRPDLSPNLCALFVEEAHRHKGIAQQLLSFAANDMATFGLDRLYLVTDHVGLYERYGWSFLTMVNDADGNTTRMYVVETDAQCELPN